jgi:hypothetical protein
MNCPNCSRFEDATSIAGLSGGEDWRLSVSYGASGKWGPKGMEDASEEDDANWTEMMGNEHCGGSEYAYNGCRQ